MLSQIGALPAFVGGSSSGCRLSILYAMRYPSDVLGMLLWRVTGGGRAAQRLAKRYYGDPIAAAREGGMAAVCAMEHFAECIKARPENRQRLMSMDPKRFIEVMSRWNEGFLAGADLPVIGATEADLKAIKAPACVVPGNDLSHRPETAANFCRLVPNAESHPLVTQTFDLDVAPRDEWNEKEDQLVKIFTDFLQRVRAKSSH